MGPPRRSYDGEDLGPFEEPSALPTCFHTRGAVRPLQVHVPPAKPGWMQIGAGTDPKLRHLRRVHSSRYYGRLTLGYLSLGDSRGLIEVGETLTQVRTHAG